MRSLDTSQHMFVRERGASSPHQTKGPDPSPRCAPKLLAELTAHRNMALREAVGIDTDTAFLALVHALAANVFFHNGRQHSCLQVSASVPYLGSAAPGIDETSTAAKVAARHEAWAKELPDDPAELWDCIAAMTVKDHRALLAHCVSLTVDAVQKPNHEHSAAPAERLALAVRLDMAAQWSPFAANYLGRVSRDRILEAVREGVSKEAADNIASMKKAAMAEAAEQRLAGRGWLPVVLRSAPDSAAGC
jgi:ParB family transcriptional regulator, chromosome partitioning protein